MKADQPTSWSEYCQLQLAHPNSGREKHTSAPLQVQAQQFSSSPPKPVSERANGCSWVYETVKPYESLYKMKLCSFFGHSEILLRYKKLVFSEQNLFRITSSFMVKEIFKSPQP